MGGATGVLAVLAVLVLTAAAPAELTAARAFEVYAIRYATAPGLRVSSFVVGADPSRTADVPFIFWAVKGGEGRNVLIDTGCYRGPAFERWKLADFVKPSVAVGKVGLTPDAITDIIVTHIHFDHVGGIDLFPKARVWIQRSEYEHHVDDKGAPKSDVIEATDAALLAKLRESGNLKFVDGDAKEIIPGITVYTGGKHTYGAQYVAVETAAGKVVVASDNIYMYENLEKKLPLGLTGDSQSDLKAQARMLTIASSPRLIVPGHDPAVFVRFPKPGNGVAKIE
jgi:glyoxylase-like metal-dependent hydrolase (beta-lactamase superfamily II)